EATSGASGSESAHSSAGCASPLGSPGGPVRARAQVSTKGNGGHRSGALAFSLTEWKPVLRPGGVIGTAVPCEVKGKFHGYLELGGANLNSTETDDLLSLVQCRVEVYARNELGQ